MSNKLEIDSNFPGGNISVKNISESTVSLEIDNRDSASEWFYWSFRVRNASGRTIQFQFPNNKIGALGPAVSTDERKTWKWHLKERCIAPSFTYTFDTDEAVHFCVGMGYTAEHWERFIAPYLAKDLLLETALCRTPKGRHFNSYSMGSCQKKTKHKIVLMARSHACEMMASYVIEGFIAALHSAQNTWRTHFLKDHEIMIVPFLDVDGVEDGDQGKSRKPHDHNRDYGKSPIYSEIEAIKKHCSNWDEGDVLAVIDLHCPYLHGESWNEQTYTVGSSDPRIQEEQLKFNTLIAQCAEVPTHMKPHLLQYGQAWNHAQNFSTGACGADWATSELRADVAMTLEIPYALSDGAAVTSNSAKRFGGALAHALSLYSQTCEK